MPNVHVEVKKFFLGRGKMEGESSETTETDGTKELALKTTKSDKPENR